MTLYAWSIVTGRASKKGPVRDDSIGSFVRTRRRTNRLTQRQLAELAGVGVRFVRELEAGKPTARIDVTNAVLRVFGRRLGLVDLPGDGER